MSAFFPWIIQSILIGVLAVLCVWLAPARIHGAVRQAAPVLAFAALHLLVVGLLKPLPKIEVILPADPIVIHNNYGGVLGIVWSVGCLFGLLRIAVGHWQVRRIVRKAEPLPQWTPLLINCQRTLGLRGSVELRLAPQGFVPSAAGLFRRCVLLPVDALGWTQEQLRLVLLHELGHFRRGDLWIHALGRLACALHWFNPFVWLLHRQLANERELACDALVLTHGVNPITYATLLFDMATSLRPRPALIAMAPPRGGKLEHRVQAILHSGGKPSIFARAGDWLLCITAAIVLLLIVACKPVARTFSPLTLWPVAEVEARFAADPFPADS